MLRDERQQKIYDILQKDGFVEINNLCRTFNVTDMTIRRDLDCLTQEYDIIRTHGGARLDGSRSEEPSYENRIVSNSESKEEIAKKALSLIKDGQTLFIDSGTTTLFVAQGMNEDFHNTVVTNGINIANAILNNESVGVLLIGGDLRKNTHSTRGPLAEEQVKKFKFDIAFIGANAIDEDGQLYVGNTAETGFKSSVMKAASKIYVLIDSSKFNMYSLISYANGTDVTGIITDRGIPKNIVQVLTDRGINIIIAD